MQGLLSNEVLTSLENAINVASFRHSVLSENIANVETPGYQRKDIPFQALLKRQMTSDTSQLTPRITHPNHLYSTGDAGSAFQANVIRPKDTQIDEKGNNVNIDLEMGTMAQNTIYHEVVTDLLSRKFSSIKMAIKGR